MAAKIGNQKRTGHAMDGYRVKDATRPLSIIVGPQDVKLARKHKKDPRFCVVAQACRRDSDIAEARIHLSRAYLRHKGETGWTRYIVPKAMRTEVFDRGGEFAPHEFNLLRPSKWQKLGRDAGAGPQEDEGAPTCQGAHHAERAQSAGAHQPVSTTIPRIRRPCDDHPECDLCRSASDLYDAGETLVLQPSHDGSSSCRMRASIASGGTQAHCTCDACF